jgi:asparagine synthase (glutamine-hydrolysing)
MCGIVAIIGLDGMPVERAAVERMTASLVHRGPDEGGIYQSTGVGLGFRRLAILDLSPAARQPMVSEDGDLALVFNGEIFNFVELREELRSLGYRFRSSGDSEVLLHSYRHWGRACVQKFNGMWAFLIYDRRRKLVFGSRDRFGIKPLYLYRGDDQWLFASEIKAILVSGLYRREWNWDNISRFLVQNRLDEGTETFYAGIDQIAAGSTFELDLRGKWRQWRYWSLAAIRGEEPEDPAAAFAEIFEDAVRVHMRSDVPVGICLSGGLDSSSIICAAARVKVAGGEEPVEPLLAFSYMAEEYDETAYIAETVRHAGAELKRLETRPLDLWKNIERVLWFHDEPVHSMTALVGFALMGSISSHGIRVVLNGQGADETLGGYSSYFTDYWYTLMRAGRLGQVWREMVLHALVHDGRPRSLFLRGLRHCAQSELNRLALYRRAAEWKHRQRDRAHPWFSPEFLERLPREEIQDVDRTLDAVLTRSVERFPLPLYLRIEDRNSMAHSIEARLPFLDYRLVSLAFRLRPEWKMRGPWNKYVLREAMRSRIPESVRTRPDKMGFPVPEKSWFAGALFEGIQDLLRSRQAQERGIYRMGAIRQDLERHRQGTIDVTRQLFNVCQFEVLSTMAGTSGTIGNEAFPARVGAAAAAGATGGGGVIHVGG